MPINYTYHYAGPHMLLSNGEGLIVSLSDESGYFYMPNFAVNNLSMTSEIDGVRRADFDVTGMGRCRFLRNYKEALELIDPLGGMTIQQLLHAAQQRMELRKASL